ncbi:MAG: S1C family serine protease, partial [Candidatus Promineifilaceae bacterium]
VYTGRGRAGAGTILHPDGLIVTNAHVIQRRPAEVRLADGRRLAARLLACDEGCDLAALSIAAGDLPALELANGRGPRPGEWVLALGHPWGVAGAVSAGMVIAAGRPLEGLRFDGALIQAGLQLRPGHSGGPMLDCAGRLVGINTMINGPAVGLAIPAGAVKRFLKRAL